MKLLSLLSHLAAHTDMPSCLRCRLCSASAYRVTVFGPRHCVQPEVPATMAGLEREAKSDSKISRNLGTTSSVIARIGTYEIMQIRHNHRHVADHKPNMGSPLMLALVALVGQNFFPPLGGISGIS